ncbi:MAG TPA: DUF4340 domain-containing protein, partial [Humisphaera sp.]
MNFRTTVILLVLLVGAAVFLVIVNRGENAEPVAAPPSGKVADEAAKGSKLLDVRAGDVAKVVVAPGGGAPAGSPTLELARDGQKWKLVRPVAWAAREFEVDSLVAGLVDLRSRAKVDLSGANRATLGLDNPRYTVELTTAGGKVQKLAVGKPTVGSQVAVVANADAEASLVAGGGAAFERFEDGLQKAVDALRDPALVTGVNTPDVTKVEVERAGGEPLVFERAGTGWRVNGPTTQPAEKSVVDDVVSTVANLRATEFPTAPPSDVTASFARPAAVVRMWVKRDPLLPAAKVAVPAPATEGGPNVVLTIGRAADVKREQAWVRVGAAVPVVARASVGKAALDQILGLTPLSARDRKVLPVESAEQVTGVSIAVERPGEKPKVTTALARKAEKLELGPPLPKDGPAAPTTAATKDAPVAPKDAPVVPKEAPATKKEAPAAPATKPADAAPAEAAPPPAPAPTTAPA